MSLGFNFPKLWFIIMMIILNVTVLKIPHFGDSVKFYLEELIGIDGWADISASKAAFLYKS